jgi:type II secretion system protein N
VQKFSRIVLLLSGAFVALAGIILLSGNLYVQSQGTQARIQQELRQRLGLSLKIGRISVTPWGGLKLSGISIPQVTAGTPANFLEAKNIALRFGFFSLFSRRLVIKQVSLLDPKVTWLQNADGKWRLPDLRENEPGNSVVSSPVPAQSPSGESRVTPTSASPTLTPAKPSELPGSVSAKTENAFVPEIRRVNLTGGNFRFLDRSGKMLAAFEGVGFRSSLRNAASLHGNARVTKISLRDRFFLEQLKSPLQYDPAGLELAEISAHAGGGDIMGRFSMQPQSEDSPFKLEVKFRNVQADRLVSEAGGPKGVMQGQLEGNFDAAGKTADQNALTGAGQIFLRDGQVQQYSLLVALGQILQIEELMQLHLEQAQAKYHISPGVVTVDELTLHSTNIRLSATGTITFAGKLHLDSRLAIDEKIRSQLFKPVRANFQPADESGYSAIDFEVGGTIDRPKTNLLEKMVGRDLKDLVNSFWGGKVDRPKKKKSAETAPEDTLVSPSPSAPAPEATPPVGPTTPVPSP